MAQLAKFFKCCRNFSTVSLKVSLCGRLAQAYSAPMHSASVNSVAFAPHELGLILAAASSDGSISILTYHEGAWSPYKVWLLSLWVKERSTGHERT